MLQRNIGMKRARALALSAIIYPFIHCPIQVFQWFGGDFTKAGHDSVIDALLPYMPGHVQEYVAQNKASLKIAYFNYDWGLNGHSPGAPGKRGPC